MALGTYSELQAAIATWLDREDLTAVIPDFITMAEVRLNDRLRLAPMERVWTFSSASFASAIVLVDEETGAILTGDGAQLTDEDASQVVPVAIGAAPLPSDFLEIRMLAPTAYPGRPIMLAGPAWASHTYYGLSGYPDVYTIIGSSLGVYPTTTGALSMTYYAKIPALTDDAPTNWLLTSRPQLYLYASLLEAEPFFRDDNRVGVWKAMLDEAIANAKVSDIGTRWSNAAVRLSGPTP